MTLIAKTVWLLILVALIVGVAIGYGISIPEKQALQSKLQGLEQASKQVSQIQSELQKLSQENEQLKKQVSELQKKLNPNYVENIKARGKLIVGTSADWPPFEYVNEKGQIVGIDIEIAKRIAKELGVELEIKDMKFAALIEALKNGLIDMILADMTPTPEREQVVDFSIPYYFSKGNALITLKGKEVKSVDELKGKRVGVQLGTIQEEWAKENLKDIAEVVSYDKVYPDMVMVLKRGDVDAIIVGDKMGSVLVERDSDLTIAMYVGGEQIGGAVAIPQGAEDLKFVVNKVIDELMTSGELKKIFDNKIAEWLGIS